LEAAGFHPNNRVDVGNNEVEPSFDGRGKMGGVLRPKVLDPKVHFDTCITTCINESSVNRLPNRTLNISIAGVAPFVVVLELRI
jgi:hypothetical protein